MIWENPILMNNLLLSLVALGFLSVVIWLFKDVFDRGKA